jgi:hypothetical protein
MCHKLEQQAQQQSSRGRHRHQPLEEAECWLILKLQASRVRPPSVEVLRNGGSILEPKRWRRSCWGCAREDTDTGGGGGVDGALDAGERRGRSCGRRRGRSKEVGRGRRRHGRRRRRLRGRAEPERKMECVERELEMRRLQLVH